MPWTLRVTLQLKPIVLTQAQYDAMVPPRPPLTYYIVG